MFYRECGTNSSWTNTGKNLLLQLVIHIQPISFTYLFHLLQYSGPSKDALAYIEWVKEDQRFSDILVQISPAINGHAFPKLKLRYKPSLVQVSYIFIGPTYHSLLFLYSCKFAWSKIYILSDKGHDILHVSSVIGSNISYELSYKHSLMLFSNQLCPIIIDSWEMAFHISLCLTHQCELRLLHHLNGRVSWMR